MANKTSWLQVRMTEQQKATLKRLADAEGETISGYVLSRVLPATDEEFERLVPSLSDPDVDRRTTLEALERDLERLPAEGFADVLPPPAPDALQPTMLNFLCAMIETAAHDKGVEPPAWVRDVPPLSRPHFMWSLRSLTPHQLRVAPVPFKRRNIFIDASDGLRL